MKGKVAVVTGSTSGIGLGIAERLAAAGCDIMLNSRRHAAAIDDLCAEMGHRNGVRVRFGPADMSRPGEVEGLIDAATKELGQVDVLVNNAGIQYTAPVHEFPPERWDAIVAINLSSVFHATRIVLPQMLARGWGRIINVASTHGLVASAHKSAYVAAKHGVVGLTKVVALETAETGVTCNAICPGWVLTPLVAKQIEDRARDEGRPYADAKLDLLEEKQPSKEFVTVEQLGDLAVFLCTPAADQIRGQAIAMDGGWTAQ